jgi:probable phosphoglycerate mutase
LTPERAGEAGGVGPVWLVRHASTDWTGTRWCGRSDPGLTLAGRKAAERLAGGIATGLAADSAVAGRNGPLTRRPAVLASPLRRAVETADAIARAVGSRVRVDSSLAEVDFGMVDGLTWEELVAAYPDLSEAIVADSRPDWPGGETASEIAIRAGSAVERIGGIALNGPVIAVSHGALLREIAGRMATTEPALNTPFAPASARRLDFLDGRWLPAAWGIAVNVG